MKHRSKTIRITEQELYEIALGASHIGYNGGKERFAAEIERQFLMLASFERPKAGWFHRHSNKLFFFASISFLLLTMRMIAEGYWGR